MFPAKLGRVYKGSITSLCVMCIAALLIRHQQCVGLHRATALKQSVLVANSNGLGKDPVVYKALNTCSVSSSVSQ